MITPFEIYLVMQLNNISCLLGVTALVSGIVTFGCYLFGAIEKSSSKISPESSWSQREAENAVALFGIGKKAAVILVVSGLLAAFTPSSSTAAAMIVIPKIANSETIQKEAGDLYDIAKDALRNLAKPKDKGE